MLSIRANSQDDHFDSSISWYAIYTRHQHEKTVARILTSKGFETLLPLYSAVRRWKDRTKLLSLPLFPSYVFLKGGLERPLDILTTPGIHALVSTAGQPAPIPHADIEAIRRAVESGASVEILGKAASVEIDAFLIERLNCAPPTLDHSDYRLQTTQAYLA